LQTKTCPSCGAEVPSAAARCKHCFYDFAAEGAQSKSSNALIGLLSFILVLLLIGLGTSYYLLGYQKAEKVIVDQETKSVVYTRTSSEGTETERVPFALIQKVEHVIGGDKAMYKVVAMGSNGKEYLLKMSTSDSLAGDAAHMAAVMGKPYEEVNHIPGTEESLGGRSGSSAGTSATSGTK